jgi:hypothetical protein
MRQALSREHRKILETTVAQVRIAVEAGAGKVLQALAVGAKDAPAHATDAEKKLRVHLRAQAVRSAICCAGTTRKPSTTSSPKLPTSTGTVCYLQGFWPRALCSYPVSLNDCKEDAQDTQTRFDSPARSEWEVAGHYASALLAKLPSSRPITACAGATSSGRHRRR